MKPALLNSIVFVLMMTSAYTSFGQCDTLTIQNLISSNLTHNSVRINWDPMQHGNAYDIGITTMTTPPDNGQTTINTVMAFTGLKANTTYCVFVKGKCTNGTYTPWASTCFTTLTAPSGITTVQGDAISIFPNPVADKLYITAPAGQHHILIRDLLGKTVYKATSNNNKEAINLSSIPKGLYFVTVSGKDYTRTQKVTKE